LFKSAVFVSVAAVLGNALSADEPKANLQQTMLTRVNPQALALWDITNKSQDAAGNFD
jgi:hypothetical protein